MRAIATEAAQRRGSVLVGLLWCVALLAVVVIGVLHTARLDLMVVKGHGDEIQAHYLALAGIEKAKALLYHDAAERRRNGKNHSGALFDAPDQFRDVQMGRGQFRVFRQGDEGSGLVYGVSDEESRLDLSHAPESELMGLEGMTAEVVAAIADWRDPDDSARDGGAEAEYYASLQPPRRPRNGPFRTLRELGMVRGVPMDLLLGEDANENGLLDPAEDGRAGDWPLDDSDGALDTGWAKELTVHSAVRNVNAAGELRVNLQTADEGALRTVPGITAELARAIVAFRGQREFTSLADRLEVTAGGPPNAPPVNVPVAAVDAERGTPVPMAGAAVPPAVVPGQPAAAQGQPVAAPTGPRLVNEELLMEIGDDLTTFQGAVLSGVININTASEAVLACLPGINRQLARAIVAYRASAGFFPNVAWLLKVDGMDRDRFRELAPRVSARSETYRIMSEGQVGSTGARKRILVTVRVGQLRIETLAYREDHL
jgi:DNA uptake protein ComE-like DNA-binding protein